MTAPRPPKKSETLEIRLSHTEKQTFMARCQAEGVTASEKVRGLMRAPAARPSRSSRSWQAAAAAVAGLILGAVVAPSIAQALPGSRAAFEKMDADNNGVVTLREFQAR